MLDEAFRRRVARLAAQNEGVLSEESRERVVDKVLAQGASLARSGRRRGLVLRVAAPLAVAAGVAAAVYAERRPQPVEATAAEQLVTAEGRACESRPVPGEAGNGFSSFGAGTRVDLGAVGVAVLAPGSVGRLDAIAPCSTRIGLDSGTVVVEARDLLGGELTVGAGDAEVSVRGTLFSVRREGALLVVDVAEGRVWVRRAGETHVVDAGRRWMMSSIGVSVSQLESAAEGRLRSLLATGRAEPAPPVTALEALPTAEPAPQAPAAVVSRPATGSERGAIPRAEASADGSRPEAAKEEPANEPTPEMWLERAEARRRDGAHAEARVLYRRAAEGSGPTAEAAWLSLARMELSLGNAGAARAATAHRRERFGDGALAPEALWIDVRACELAGDRAAAERAARELVSRWPNSPQSAAARRLLER